MARSSASDSGDERTPLIHAATDAESDADTKIPHNPANLSTSKVVTILAANWVSCAYMI
jgi:hypothetical protein